MTKNNFENRTTLTATPEVTHLGSAKVHKRNSANASEAMLFLTYHAEGVVKTKELLGMVKEDAERRIKAAELKGEQPADVDVLASGLEPDKVDANHEALARMGELSRDAIYYRPGDEPVSFAELVASTYGETGNGFPKSDKIYLALIPLQEFKEWQQELAAQAEAAAGTTEEQA